LYSGRCEILYNDIYSNNYTGILATQSVSWLIQGNQIWSQDYSIGIALQYSHYFIIDSNEIYNNPFGGIRFYLSNNCNFTNNFVYENAHLGVQIDACNDILVRGNIIFDNGGTGIRLFEANATWIYYNDLVANGGGDALELNSTGQNYWDDNVSMGNWWWEIARDLTNYTISNGTATVNFDRYPMTSMWIDDALAAGYEITTTGNSVIWSAYAHNPDYYEVYDGATLLGSGTWTGSDITFIIDGLSAGLHDLEIVIYHISGHTLTASVAVTVDDETAPTWVSTPTDQVIEYGQALSYQLLAADPSGIQSWAVNDTVHFSIVDGLLTNNGVLAPGSYGLQITVEDPYGNQLSVIITVTVRESLLGPMLLFVAAGGGIVLVVVIIIIAKKKQGT
jgi:parallel beta-helix repeat protein